MKLSSSSLRWIAVVILAALFIAGVLLSVLHSVDEANRRAAVLETFLRYVRVSQPILNSTDFAQMFDRVEHSKSGSTHNISEKSNPIHVGHQITKQVHSLESGLLAGPNNLTCKVSFPPKCNMYFYVQFWNQRFRQRDCFESPLRPVTREQTPYQDQKYVLFEPDRGGWNNIRMAAEVAVIFAHATGRTLVLPAPGYWYLLTQSSDHEDNLSSLDKFFDMDKLRESMTMISTVDFLSKVAKQPGILKRPLPQSTDVHSILRPREKLCSYYESAAYIEDWEPGKQFIGFNLSLQYPSGLGQIIGKEVEKPRCREMVAHGRKLRPYDEQLHSERAIYFPGDYRNRYRILTHFYTYLYWTDPAEARRYKRLVRDRLHYRDDIFCAAGFIIRLLHEEAARLQPGQTLPHPPHSTSLYQGGDTQKGATFFAMHVRRGDFQYKETRVSATQLWDHVGPQLNRSVSPLLYIATDEKDKHFFAPFSRRDSGGYTVRFFRDYEEQLHKAYPDFDTNHIGMVEQVVCANAHTFFGTPRSSFTGYITRMRGYYRDGRYARTYYTLPKEMFALQKQKRLIGPFWAREFEIAHRNADDAYQESA